MYVIEWTNDNNGFVMALLTAAYVIATIFIVLESRRTANLHAKALVQAAKLEIDRLRPRVLVSFEFLPGSFRSHESRAYVHLHIKNWGQSAAIDLTVTMEPEPTGSPFDDDRQRKSAILGQNISLLAPQQIVKDLIDSGSEFVKRYESTVFVVKAVYKDAAGTAYADTHDLNLGPVDAREISDPLQKIIWDLTMDAGKAVRDLHSIAESLASPDKSAFMTPLPRGSPLTDAQNKLLESLRRMPCGEVPGFMAHRTLGNAQATIHSFGSNEEASGDMSDIEYLIRAGRLQGYYLNGALLFFLTANG